MRCGGCGRCNILTLTPPLIITRDEIDRGLDIVEECLTELEAPGL